ncbi:MAG: DUF4406 domain-containing protein [Clostridium sp.]|nr:DUF4406 domain-containing protein [Clostridium sp.]
MDRFNAEGYPDPTAAEALANIAREEKARNWKPCVFICSPFAGDIDRNTLNARRYLKFAIDKGVIPFAPHLLYPPVLDEHDPAQRELGLYFGMVWLGKCDELWVFGSYISSGMGAEIARARKRRIPIRYFTENCEEVQGI